MAPHATETPPSSSPAPIQTKSVIDNDLPAHQDTSSQQHLPTEKHDETIQLSNGSLEATTDTSAVSIPDPVLQVAPTESRFTVSSVIPHRTSSETKLPVGVALFSSAEMFKSSIAKSQPPATGDFYNSHLSREAKARKPSSLKGAMKHFHPGIISLCGGLPSSTYFPFSTISAETANPPTFTPATGTSVSSTGKYDTTNGTSEYDLSIALNYGQSMGPPQLMRYLTEHTEIIHAPRYSNWEICMTQGSTSALDMLLRMFCERGDAVLFEEYSFSSAIETATPLGLAPVGVHLDGKGMIPAHLDDLLTNWESHRARYGNADKPKVLYTIPTGQNPTGATQDLQRRKDIYVLCDKHNVIILEDEPYYFLQMDAYISGRVHTTPSTSSDTTPAPPMTLETFISSLVPSYLSLDTSGRVIRIDSFSKIIAPGSRTGWITGHASLIERFVRASEYSAQNPSGFSMTHLYKLLEEQWGHKGFLEWLMYIRTEYTRRRDVMLAACESHLPRDVCSWEDTRAGMFHWITVDGSKHAEWKLLKTLSETERAVRMSALEEKIFLAAVGHEVLVARGSWFRSAQDEFDQTLTQTVESAHSQDVNVNGDDAKTEEGTDIDSRLYFRMTFAAASEGQIDEAVRRFGNALKAEFGIAC